MSEADYPSVYQLLKKYHIQPKKGLGQNFLADENHLKKILTAADLSPEDTVLEIGPGLGTLSARLTAQVRRVVAVEIDGQMVEILRAEMGTRPNFSVVMADILAVDPAAVLSQSNKVTELTESSTPSPDFIPGQSYHVVANLPYYITSAIIQHLLEALHPPQKIIITVQKEVAQRIVASPGQMSILAVSVQFYGRPTLCHTIPANAFVPSPKVDSAVLRIDRYQTPPVTVADRVMFFRLVKAGFGQKRKQLKNALATGLHKPQAEIKALMQAAGIDQTRRAQTLSLGEWARLTEVIADQEIRD